MARARGRRSKGTGEIELDFSGVKERTRIQDGSYPAEIISVEQKQGNKGPYLSFKFQVTEGKSKGGTLYDNCSLAPQALFGLKNLMNALEIEVPKKAFTLDPQELVGMECIIEVVTELYDGKPKPTVVDYMSLHDKGGDDEEEEEDEGYDGDLIETLEDLSSKELSNLAKALGVKNTKIKKLDDDELIDYLMEEFDEEDILEELDDDEEEDDYEEDYSTYSLKELKEIAKEEGIKVTKKMSKEDIIELLED